MSEYIHGFSENEKQRLLDQNNVLAKYIYKNIDLSSFNHILELGCGVGAQMIYVLNQYPNLKVTGIDKSLTQIEKAKENLYASNIDPSRYQLIHSNQLDATYIDSFDALLVVWVLEHVTTNPSDLLSSMKTFLKEEGRVFITEVQHSNFRITPRSSIIESFWNEAIRFQKELGGNANIGKELHSILMNAGMKKIQVHPFKLDFDASTKNAKNEILNYWKSLMKSAAIEMIQAERYTESSWNKVEKAMNNSIANDESTFYYAFIQGFCHF